MHLLVISCLPLALASIFLFATGTVAAEIEEESRYDTMKMMMCGDEMAGMRSQIMECTQKIDFAGYEKVLTPCGAELESMDMEGMRTFFCNTPKEEMIKVEDCMEEKMKELELEEEMRKKGEPIEIIIASKLYIQRIHLTKTMHLLTLVTLQVVLLIGLDLAQADKYDDAFEKLNMLMCDNDEEEAREKVFGCMTEDMFSEYDSIVESCNGPKISSAEDMVEVWCNTSKEDLVEMGKCFEEKVEEQGKREELEQKGKQAEVIIHYDYFHKTYYVEKENMIT
ncbi:hypothetical protein CDAR_487261 [Caerostris darwini]|uniref:Uncharacterized protein n=1 Tax=Caerostris darwini TaxID=1538125 RepID=A0AAV4QE36_9ARAC|nr:hypothetical protein CDAR_487261 [Caerostris darwini]